MTTETGIIGRFGATLIACMLILVCVAVGAVGLILPVVPGLLFLAIALMLVARLSPSIDRRLRRNRTIASGHIHRDSDGK